MKQYVCRNSFCDQLILVMIRYIVTDPGKVMSSSGMETSLSLNSCDISSPLVISFGIALINRLKHYSILHTPKCRL